MKFYFTSRIRVFLFHEEKQIHIQRAGPFEWNPSDYWYHLHVSMFLPLEQEILLPESNHLKIQTRENVSKRRNLSEEQKMTLTCLCRRRCKILIAQAIMQQGKRNPAARSKKSCRNWPVNQDWFNMNQSYAKVTQITYREKGRWIIISIRICDRQCMPQQQKRH